MGATGKKEHPSRCIFVASLEKLPGERLMPLI
jgi:hypothetical protein